MPYLKNHRDVDFPAERLYRAIIDIESYPELLSFIRHVTITERGDGFMKATVAVGLPALNFSYQCLITFRDNEYIAVDQISGPFQKLHARWEFAALEKNRTRIGYLLDSKFKNPLIELTAGAIFASQLAHSIDVFARRLKKS